MKVQPRSIYAEYQIMTKFFSIKFMKIWYDNFSAYENAREKFSFQQIFDTLKQY